MGSRPALVTDRWWPPPVSRPPVRQATGSRESAPDRSPCRVDGSRRPHGGPAPRVRHRRRHRASATRPVAARSLPADASGQPLGAPVFATRAPSSRHVFSTAPCGVQSVVFFTDTPSALPRALLAGPAATAANHYAGGVSHSPPRALAVLIRALDAAPLPRLSLAIPDPRAGTAHTLAVHPISPALIFLI